MKTDAKWNIIKGSDGALIMTTSIFEEDIYNKRVKQWIRDKKSLRATVRSLYYIVWGQCLTLMQEKLSMSKHVNDMETKEDVMLLLKEIHTIRLQIETNTSLYDALYEAT